MAEFEWLDKDSIDMVVAKGTCFESWDEMMETVTEKYIGKKLKKVGFDGE